MKKLSIIILSYNVERLLLDCLESIPKHADWEVIVIDNASTDNSILSVKKKFPKVKLIINSQNLGFSTGNNIGIHKSSGEYVLLLNPDTIVYPGTIETVLKYMDSHKDVGAATCRVELPNGSLDYSCHRGFPDPFGAFLHFLGLKRFSRYSSTRIPDTIHEIDALTGAFALIRRRVGDEVGWLDEDYFWNGEDIDLCYKIKEKKYKIVYIPGIKITHFKGSSSGIHKTGAGNPTREITTRSLLSGTQVMRLFYRKRLASKYPFFLNWLVYLGIFILETLRLIMGRV